MLCARRLSKYVKPAQSKVLHRLYLWGIWIKGVDGLVEIIVGVLLLAISQAALNRFVSGLIRHQWHVTIFERLTTHLRQSMHYVSNGTKLFGSAYLLGHGTIKAGLVWGGLLRGKMWAFPAALVCIGGFICYQAVRVICHFSMALFCLTSFDCAIFLLIWREYRVAKQCPR